MHDFVGSPGFFAPEMLRHANYSARKVDLWSLGCVVLELLLGHGQFDKVWMDSYAHRALQDVALFDRLLSSAVETVRNTTRWPSPELRAIEMRLLQPDEELRISLDDLCAHPWLQIAQSERAAAAAAQPKPASTDDGARKLAEAAASSAAAAPLSTSRRGRPPPLDAISPSRTGSHRPPYEATPHAATRKPIRGIPSFPTSSSSPALSRADSSSPSSARKPLFTKAPAPSLRLGSLRLGPSPVSVDSIDDSPVQLPAVPGARPDPDERPAALPQA